jgi:hypothetical protein
MTASRSDAEGRVTGAPHNKHDYIFSDYHPYVRHEVVDGTLVVYVRQGAHIKQNTIEMFQLYREVSGHKALEFRMLERL